MKSLVWEVACGHFFLSFLIKSFGGCLGLELPSSEPLVGRSPTTRAASLATDDGVDEWQRSLPLLVSLEGSGQVRQGERIDSYDYSRCRRVFCSCVVSSFHACSDSRGCLAGHIRFGDIEFRLARSRVVPHEAFANSMSGHLGWSQQGSWLAVLVRSIPFVSLQVGGCFVFKNRCSHSFCRRPACDHVT